MLVDTHAHLNFIAFEKDREKVIKECLDNDVWLLNVGTNYETSKKAIEIAEQYPQGVYATIGLHPMDLDTGLMKIKLDTNEFRENYSFEKEFEIEKYKKLALSSKKVVAIGEIGLDYYYRPKTTRKKELFKQRQKELLKKQLGLAKQLNLPVIFHCRLAHQDLVEILSQNPEIMPDQAVAHSFVGDLDQLQKYLDFGFYIGFNGIIFKSIKGIDFEEAIKKTPLDRILIETDCPYLTPPNFEEERNNPLAVKLIAERIAKIKNKAFGEIAEITTENAKTLFKI